MQLPFKITHGAVFRTAVVDTINSIIDYLRASRVKGDNRTIKVQETAGGVIISAIPQSIPSKGNANGIAMTAITTRPNGGYGPAFDATITLAADGNWEATGDDRAIVVPRQV